MLRSISELPQQAFTYRVRTVQHTAGLKRAVRGTPRQPPGWYFGIWCQEVNGWFRYSYTTEAHAQQVATELATGTTEQICRKNGVEWNFTGDFSDTHIRCPKAPKHKKTPEAERPGAFWYGPHDTDAEGVTSYRLWYDKNFGDQFDIIPQNVLDIIVPILRRVGIVVHDHLPDDDANVQLNSEVTPE